MENKNLTDLGFFFESERLGFRSFRDSDLKLFHRINSDPEVMNYFPSILTQEETSSLMSRVNNHINEHGYGFFAVNHLSDKKFIGFIGIKNTNFDADFTPCVEIGWRLDSRYWNQGLATEGALSCLEFGFTEFQFNEIYSFTPLSNTPSERVMQKIGMSKVGEFDHPNLEEGHILKTHSLYRLTKNEFDKGILCKS